MRIEELERLVKAHSQLMQTLAPVIRGDGDVHYNFSASKEAIDAIAKCITREAQTL